MTSGYKKDWTNAVKQASVKKVGVKVTNELSDKLRLKKTEIIQNQNLTEEHKLARRSAVLIVFDFFERFFPHLLFHFELYYLCLLRAEL